MPKSSKMKERREARRLERVEARLRYRLDLQGSTRVNTRFRRQALGMCPIKDPIVWSDCLLCTKGYYSDDHLRQHYAKNHNLDFGEADLPTNLEQLENTQFHPDQQLLRCGLCREVFADVDALINHKTTHVPPQFMKYKCEDCGKKFVLKPLLVSHKDECDGTRGTR